MVSGASVGRAMPSSAASAAPVDDWITVAAAARPSEVGAAQAQSADQRRQGQALQQQRPDGDHQGAEQEQVTVRRTFRDQVRRGQGDHATQPGPADDQDR